MPVNCYKEYRKIYQINNPMLAWFFSPVLNFFNHYKSKTMLRWAVIFLVIALVAALFGFTGIAASAAGIAKILFYIFLVLFLLSIIAGAFNRR